jgi:hypothetical protein
MWWAGALGSASHPSGSSGSASGSYLATLRSTRACQHQHDLCGLMHALCCPWSLEEGAQLGPKPNRPRPSKPDVELCPQTAWS